MWSFFISFLIYICKMKKNLHVVIISVLFSIILWVSITLSNDFYATIDIPLKIVDFPQGYTTGTPLPDKVSIKIKGKGWKLIAVKLGSESDYVISAAGDSGKESVNLYNYLVENQWLSSDVEVIDILPDTLTFYVERIINRRLPVDPNLILNFKPGYGIAAPITVFPDSIIVYGPKSYVSKLTTVPTQSHEFDNLDERTVEHIPLKNLRGMTYQFSSVTVNLDVQRIVDKNFDGIPVNVHDVPRDRDVVLLPNRLTLGIRGGIEILGKLDTSDFNAYVNYSEVVLDTLGSIIPHITIPENTTLIYTKPERLRYIIKKFN